MTAARRALASLGLFSFVALVSVTGLHAASAAAKPRTTATTLSVGDKPSELTPLHPVRIDGREVSRGSVIVRFKEGVSARAKSDAHRSADAVQVHALGLPRTERVDV